MSLLLLLFPYRSAVGTSGRKPQMKSATPAAPKVRQGA